ncbi:zinc finger protein 648-like [Coregonus clupeaformis]|uniref:zinc finger protein 648-like n=1 Tax=Coregonus clupeaformis TaxID=59861 RepID=UPI001BDFA80D|nr:zinc finger protein 648-like [Coregonus clupeaformis]
MVEEMPSWTSEKFADKVYISKRSIRKNVMNKMHYVSHVPSESVTVSTAYKVERDSNPSDNDDTDSLSGSSFTWMIALNPQTPTWTLAEKRLSAYQDLWSPPGSPTAIEHNIANRRGSTCVDGVYSDSSQQEEGNIKNITKRRLQRKVCSGDPSDLKLRLVREIRPKPNKAPSDVRCDMFDVCGKKGNGKSGVSLVIPPPLNKADACEKDKVPMVFTAMKKRGVEGDTENRPYKCTHCNWAFKKSSNLQSHLVTHSGLKAHVCDLCGKAYSHQGTLQQHKRLHTGERPYHCPFCDKTYIWSSDYRKHIRTHTGEKPYVCETCGKDFVRSSDLRKHERNMHTNDKPFPCMRCGKTFNKPLSLLHHERTHLGERPFCCSICGKAFAVASRMAEHQMVHTGVRPYTCLACAKSFTKSSNLLEHQAVHSGIRPHKCSQCGVAFAMVSRLVRHQCVHTGERPFNCKGCSMSFSRTAALKRHQEQTCAGRIFVCVECDKAFQCASQLTEHMLSHDSTAATVAASAVRNTED